MLRQTDPAKNPYKEAWALFGGRVDGEGTVEELLNKELQERWNFTARITEKLWWDEDIKIDHDGEEKRFVYIDAICAAAEGDPKSANENEKLEWVALSRLSDYDLNPPTKILFEKLNYIS